jgi:pimeloyl-ACP methyl ester carboxylesterase
MKSLFKVIIRVLLGALGALAVFLIFMTTYHKVMLKKEASLIVPNGKLVYVKDHSLHVYSEGKKSDKPTLVVMSGSGVAAPVYDYKVLYSKLSDEYRVAVIEKAGYGYSDVAEISRDIKTMLEENREALKAAVEKGPYVLLPHSMSGLEALLWAQDYPDEVAAIIGLDAALPEGYANMKNRIGVISLIKASTYAGLHRISFFNPVSGRNLTEAEATQHKYLSYRNTLNNDVYEECKDVYENADQVRQGAIPNIPMLMFSSNGEGTGLGDSWVTYQRNFMKQSDKIQLVELNCGHFIHYYKSEFIASKAKEFLKAID